MEVFIQHEGQQTGPFTPQQIQAGVSSGLYQMSDLVWHQGMAEWLPLSAAPNILSAVPPIPAPGTPPLPSYNRPPQTSGLAIASMACGISAFFCGITAIPAVICGHIARGRIRESNGQIAGSGFAITGLITGYLGLVIFAIAFVAGLTAPMVINQRKKADQTEAMSNARSLGIALYEFNMDYGSFPNAETASLVAKQNDTPEITGSSSNARFRQLFHAGVTESEWSFYAKTSSSHKPDGDISGDNLLAPGECGFAYIEAASTTDDEPRPLAMTPFVTGTDRLDPVPFGGKAVILWSDNSVSSLPIDRTTGAALYEGRDILDPTHPVWNGVSFSLLLPE